MNIVMMKSRTQKSNEEGCIFGETEMEPLI